jgi:hypothetical protein
MDIDGVSTMGLGPSCNTVERLLDSPRGVHEETSAYMTGSEYGTADTRQFEETLLPLFSPLQSVDESGIMSPWWDESVLCNSSKLFSIMSLLVNAMALVKFHTLRDNASELSPVFISHCRSLLHLNKL